MVAGNPHLKNQWNLNQMFTAQKRYDQGRALGVYLLLFCFSSQTVVLGEKDLEVRGWIARELVWERRLTLIHCTLGVWTVCVEVLLTLVVVLLVVVELVEVLATQMES